MANGFFSTCSSNSVDVDHDYVVDGDDDVGDADVAWGDLVAMIAMC